MSVTLASYDKVCRCAVKSRPKMPFASNSDLNVQSDCQQQMIFIVRKPFKMYSKRDMVSMGYRGLLQKRISPNNLTLGPVTYESYKVQIAIANAYTDLLS